MFGVYVSSFVVVVIEVLAGMLTRPEVYETEAEAEAKLINNKCAT